MRPIALKGHERAITFLKYNLDGDLLFTCSKDASVQLWRVQNGERLGTFDGHKGACWSLDVTDDSRYLITGAADRLCILWNALTGQRLQHLEHETTVRSVAFSQGASMVCTVSKAEMKMEAAIIIRRFNADEGKIEETPMTVIRPKRQTLQAIFSPLNDQVYCSDEEGFLTVYDVATGELVRELELHEGAINKIQFSYDKTALITASTDHHAKLLDARTLDVVKTYKSEKPLNSAAISPLMEHVILGGGQEAALVTMTAGQLGRFETHFFHTVYEEELGRVTGHFGPIHTLAFSPDGRGFASGSEDGFVRVHHFDDDYFKGDKL